MKAVKNISTLRRARLTQAGCHFVLLALFPVLLSAQQPERFRREINAAADGRARYAQVWIAYNYYEERNRDSALAYASMAVEIAQNAKHKIAEAYSLINKGYQLIQLGRYPEGLQCLLQSFAIADNVKNERYPYWDLTAFNFHGDQRILTLSYNHHMYGILMQNIGNVDQQVFHFREALKLAAIVGYAPRLTLGSMNLGRAFLLQNQLDSAQYYEERAKKIAIDSNFKKYLGIVEMSLGDIYLACKQTPIAIQHYYEGIRVSIEQNNLSALGRNYFRLIKYHLDAGNKDSALYYARKNLVAVRAMGKIVGVENNLGSAYQNMFEAYALNGNRDSSYYYLKLANHTKDSLYALRIKNLNAYQDLSFSEQLRLREVEKEKSLYRSRIQVYVLIAGMTALLLIAGLIYRNNRQKTKAKRQIEDAYEHLKSTQAQLIQSEKMASLGELTAGIAHEIQNPLNFVNNFSEINQDLIVELQEELKAGKTTEAIAITHTISENEQKINHHGKRADAIVKGMLQHSRSGNGQKELTDINALADEYLRLAYHGLRAKDKSFNARFEFIPDPAVEKISVVTQDIGRVILNLINNAFYAVNEKQKLQLPGYEPGVRVTTKKLPGRTEIVVSDNGNGIPPEALKKIFNPFFTTKPAGEGTGLGLSLSYDIITKGHGGELTADTKLGEGTSFIIHLPDQGR